MRDGEDFGFVKHLSDEVALALCSGRAVQQALSKARTGNVWSVTTHRRGHQDNALAYRGSEIVFPTAGLRFLRVAASSNSGFQSDAPQAARA